MTALNEKPNSTEDLSADAKRVRDWLVQARDWSTNLRLTGGIRDSLYRTMVNAGVQHDAAKTTVENMVKHLTATAGFTASAAAEMGTFQQKLDLYEEAVREARQDTKSGGLKVN